MDPTIIATIIGTAGQFATALIGRWNSEPEDDSSQMEIKKIVSNHYGELRRSLTDSNARILICLQSGYNKRLKEVREKLYPELNFRNKNHLDKFDNEFRYRMEYLILLGLVMPIGGSEYAITHMGMNFLRIAKEKKDYPTDILF